MNNILLGAAISIVSSILISIVNSFIDSRKDKAKRRFALVDKVYTERIAAYKEIYSALTTLKYAFQDHSVDILETDDHSLFNPTEYVTNLRKIFLKNTIYYSEKSTENFKDVIFYLWNMSDLLPVNSDDGLDNHSIIVFAREGIGHIDECLESIKSDMGLKEIEAMFK